MRTLLLATLAATLAGCGLYFGSEPPPPDAGPCYGAAPAAIGLRNPDTGVCEYFSPGGGCYPNGGVDIAIPDWAPCGGPCEALDEVSCVASSTCHAAYVDGPPPPCAAGIVCGPTQRFVGCWGLPPSGPAVGPSCDGLDAWTCSQHPDCASHYNADPTYGAAKFDACSPELAAPLTCATGNLACAPGSHCEDLCTGLGPVACTPTCLPDLLPCDAMATPCPTGEVCFNAACPQGPPNAGPPIPGTCAAVCVPADPGPGSCTGTLTCDTVGVACPAGTVAGIANGCYTGYCIPQAACGPADPGTCDVAACASPGPTCPTGTVPGVANGCYTGFCIPEAACPVRTCDQLPTEAACQARPDCAAYYKGIDCTCTTLGCTCASEIYAACQLAGPRFHPPAP